MCRFQYQKSWPVMKARPGLWHLKVSQLHLIGQATITLLMLSLVKPDKRWPNEGFHGGQGKKSLTYDELSPQGWRENCLISITYVITH